MLDAKVHGAQATYHDGVKAPLRHADGAFPRLMPPWLDRGYRGEGKGRDLMEEVLGSGAELVERPPKPPTEEAPRPRAKQWDEEGVKVDWVHQLPLRGFRLLRRRWVVERTFSRIDQRSLHLRRDWPPDGPQNGSFVRLF